MCYRHARDPGRRLLAEQDRGVTLWVHERVKTDLGPRRGLKCQVEVLFPNLTWVLIVKWFAF